mmetsp:Transcript_64091/g.169862  ORF Transcript_64091/g.169862 Transcript_64091/m.169862 type:complete len:208 (+) Transcript_64091:1429-2052(+)
MAKLLSPPSQEYVASSTSREVPPRWAVPPPSSLATRRARMQLVVQRLDWPRGSRPWVEWMRRMPSTKRRGERGTGHWSSPGRPVIRVSGTPQYQTPSNLSPVSSTVTAVLGNMDCRCSPSHTARKKGTPTVVAVVAAVSLRATAAVAMVVVACALARWKWALSSATLEPERAEMGQAPEERPVARTPWRGQHRSPSATSPTATPPGW